MDDWGEEWAEKRAPVEASKKTPPLVIVNQSEVLKPMTIMETIYYVVAMVMYISLTLFGVLLSGWAMWGWFQ